MESDPEVRRALDADFLDATLCENRLAEILRLVQACTGSSFASKFCGNYQSADQLYTYLEKNDVLSSLEGPGAVGQMIVWISRRGPYYALTYTRRDRSVPAVWYATLDERPAEISSVCDTIEGVLAERGLARLSGAILTSPAEGHLTEMDQEPATVFERLFAEVI